MAVTTGVDTVDPVTADLEDDRTMPNVLILLADDMVEIVEPLWIVEVDVAVTTLEVTPLVREMVFLGTKARVSVGRGPEGAGVSVTFGIT